MGGKKKYIEMFGSFTEPFISSMSVYLGNECIFITSAKEVMFLPCLFVMSVCEEDYTETTASDFHKIRCKGGTWNTENPV